MSCLGLDLGLLVGLIGLFCLRWDGFGVGSLGFVWGTCMCKTLELHEVLVLVLYGGLLGGIPSAFPVPWPAIARGIKGACDDKESYQ